MLDSQIEYKALLTLLVPGRGRIGPTHWFRCIGHPEKGFYDQIMSSHITCCIPMEILWSEEHHGDIHTRCT